MAFRHYTKLKEIADRVGCDSSDCTTNGDLLDRIYETPITPVEPTGPIDAKIDIQNITARFVRPVEGHNYLGVITIPTDGWALELENVIGYKHKDGVYYAPIQTSCDIGSISCVVIFNDVENVDSGNLMLVKDRDWAFTDEDVETIKSQLPGTLICSHVDPTSEFGVAKLTITEIIDG